MSVISEIFSYGFLVRALCVGILVSLCSALLGVSLVLKRFSMIGDGLSHVGFGALSIAIAMGAAPLKVSVPVVVISAVMLLRLNKNSSMKGDSAIAVISSSALAIGVIVTSLSSGLNADLCNYMFGSILAMSREDVYISVMLSIMVLFVFILCYNRIFAITFDEDFAAATGTRASFFNMMLAVLTAVTIVVGMRLMGTLLISSLIIFPALISMRVFSNFRSVMISSAIISMVCYFAGIVISYLYSTPAGASVVAVNLAVLIIFSIIGKFIRR
ncbi:MAG: metal ABC transporter permease [Oscillospiraceae bacterium]